MQLNKAKYSFGGSDIKKCGVRFLALLVWLGLSSYSVSADLDETQIKFQKSSSVVASGLAMEAELLCIREVLGEKTELERKQDLKIFIERLRQRLPTQDELEALRLECKSAAEKLMAKAQSQIDLAHWPSDRSADEYHRLARLKLEQSRLQLIYLTAAGADVVEPARNAAEVFGWTQGRTGVGLVFDNLDQEIEVSIRDFFSGLTSLNSVSSNMGEQASVLDTSVQGTEIVDVKNTQAVGSVPLMLFWHPKRGDNFIASTPQGQHDARSTGYQFVRIEGYASTEGTPLKLYWNEKREDNFVTATAEGERSALGSGYVFVRVEAYIFNEPRAGTVPLKLYWNPERGDNITVATSQGEHDVVSNGYHFVRIEGYVNPSSS